MDAGFARWPAAQSYAALVQEAAEEHGLDPALVMGLIGVESGFDRQAYRAEPHIGDASRGLMQILYGTARAVGYQGTAQGLYDAATNVQFGTAFLADRTRSLGDPVSGISAYNNGSGKRATRVTTVCAVRNADGSCARNETVQPGEYFNQPYVDRVLAAARLFGWRDSSSGSWWPLAGLAVLLWLA